MRPSSLDIERLGNHRRDLRSASRRQSKDAKRIALSLVDLGLGDRILLEASLRLHRRNRPQDVFIAIVDRNQRVDLPYTLRRHFDELWWVGAGNGQPWEPSPRSAVARRVRDALIARRVNEIYVPSWKDRQFPRNRVYVLRRHNCIGECNYLRRLRFCPEVVVPGAFRRWAKAFLRARVPDDFRALISIHVRNYTSFPEKNLDPRVVERIVSFLRTRGRFAFLLIGRDDGPPGLAGPDVFSFVGQPWHFEQTAGIIAETRLFIGADSGPLHAAAGLGVPVIGFGCYGRHLRPFADPARYVYFQTRDRPQTIMTEVKRFIDHINLRAAGRNDDG